MTFEEPGPVAPIEPPPPPRPPGPSLWPPIGLLAIGVLLIGIMAFVERAVQPEVPWSDALLVLSDESPVKDAVPALLRKVPAENLPENPVLREIRALPQGRESLREIGLDEPKRERVVMVSAPPSQWKQLLGSGRLPTPGQPEILAGELARIDSFRMDGLTFRVVGRLRPQVSPFIFSYVLPEDPTMKPYFEKDVEKGWIVRRDELERVGRIIVTDPKWAGIKIVGGFARIPAFLTVGAVFGMALTTFGGALFLGRLCRRLEYRVPRFLRPVFTEVRLRPGLFWGLHLVSYGAWFVCMLLALAFPLGNLMVVQVVQNFFTSGELEYVGSAYASGDILAATLATFWQNFFVATFAAGIVPSLVIPFWEVFKNMLSFSVLGFAMSPIWAEHISGYTYHCITIVAELEAYILASFIVAVWPIRIVEGFMAGRPVSHIVRGLVVIISGTLVIALILFAAALYEASTLILFGKT